MVLLCCGLVNAFNLTYSGGTPTNNSNLIRNWFFINITASGNMDTCYAEVNVSNVIYSKTTISEYDSYELYNKTADCCVIGLSCIDAEHARFGYWVSPCSSTSKAVVWFNVSQNFTNKNVHNALFWWRNENEEPSVYINFSVYLNNTLNNLTGTNCLKDLSRCRNYTEPDNGFKIAEYNETGLDWNDEYGDWYSINITQYADEDTDGTLLFYFLNDILPYPDATNIFNIGDSEGFAWRSYINYTLELENLSMTVSTTTGSMNYTSLDYRTYSYTVWCNDTNSVWNNSGTYYVTLRRPSDTTICGNVSGYAQQGIEELGSWFGTIALVLAAGIIIVLVFAVPSGMITNPDIKTALGGAAIIFLIMGVLLSVGSQLVGGIC